MLGRRAACRHDRVGIFVLQFVERKRAPPGDLDRPLDGAGQAREPRGDPPALVQVPLAVGEQPVAYRLHRAAVPHGRERVEERQPRPLVVADVAGRHERHPRPPRPRAATTAGDRRRRPRAPTSARAQSRSPNTSRHCGEAARPHRSRSIAVAQAAHASGTPASSPLGMGRDVVERDDTPPSGLDAVAGLVGPRIAVREQPAEIRVARAVGRPDDQRQRHRRAPGAPRRSA